MGYLAGFWLLANVMSVVALCHRDRFAHGKAHVAPETERDIVPTLRPTVQAALDERRQRAGLAVEVLRMPDCLWGLGTGSWGLHVVGLSLSLCLCSPVPVSKASWAWGCLHSWG